MFSELNIATRYQYAVYIADGDRCICFLLSTVAYFWQCSNSVVL